MKKILSIAVIVLLGLNAAQAQTRDTINGRGYNKERRQAAREIDMTDEQKAAAKANRDQFRADMKALDEDKSLNDEQKKEKRKVLQEAYVNKMQSLMTPEQKAKMKESRGNMREERREGAGKRDSLGRKDNLNRRAGAKGLKKELNLTASQQTQMKTLNSDFKQKAVSIKKNEALTAEQKKAQLKALHNDRKAQMQTVLNKEQQDKIKAHRKEHKPARMSK